MLLSQAVLYAGVETLPPAPIALTAGPLALVLEAGDLRTIRLGDQEILRRVYVAVRDHNWGTPPAMLSDVHMDIAADHFRIDFTATHRQHQVDFVWRGAIAGDADGTLRFSMDGEARAPFRRNRIGFCVLHPMDCAGRRARITHVDGSQEETTFPIAIAPQRVADGLIHPVYPFAEMRALAHEVTPGLWAEVSFEGEIFETEDQRNWTDASFKTYGTPLRLPFPVQVQPGDRVRQAITLRLQGTLPASTVAAASRAVAGPTITVTPAPPRPLPAIGLGMASHDEPLSATETARLAALRPAHLRVDLDLASSTYADRLRRAASEAAALDSALEIALFLSDDAPAELAHLAAQLDHWRPTVARWLVFHRHEMSTSPRWVELARAVLTPYDRAAPFGGGTNAFFTELNRQRPDSAALDFLVYSINPQVHAFDNTSLVENLAAQAVTVTSAAAFAAGKPIVVSPVTLRPRGNPNATGPEPALAPGELPPPVDARQMSLLGAGWTLGSLKYLAESGAAAVTYYETTGWRGVMERAGGSPLPETFRSLPGAVFPLYHVLADVGEFAGGEVIPTTASRPLLVDGMTLQKDGERRTLIANLSAKTQTVTIEGLPAAMTVRLLDAAVAETAMTAPAAYRRAPGELRQTHGGALSLSLPPFAVATLDAG
jgi:hypothetical protein